MKFIPQNFFARHSFNKAVLLAVGLLVVGTTATVLAQLPFSPEIERKLWKELLPWGQNLSATDEVIWDEPADLNNVPSTHRVALGDFDENGVWVNDTDEFGNIIYRSGAPGHNGGWPYDWANPGEVSDRAKFQIEFDALQPGECTYSHQADYDIDASIYFPQVRQCKGPSGEMLPPPAGRLLNPAGLAIDGNRVYVSDLFNHRIQVFDFFGNVIPVQYPIGNGYPGDGSYNVAAVEGYEGYSDGSKGHRLNAPYGIALDYNPAGRRLLVADSANNRIAVFKPNGSAAFGVVDDPAVDAPIHVEFEIPVGANGEQMGDVVDDPVRPDQIAVTPGAVALAPGSQVPPSAINDRIVLTDRWHCYVIIMDTAFNVLKTLPDARPAGSQHDACLDPLDGQVQAQPGEFSTITAVKIDPAGYIYVADHAQNAVQVFDRNGVHVSWIGRPGANNPGGAGELSGPVGLLIDQFGGPNGNQFQRLGVIDEGNGRAVFYNMINGPTNVSFEFQVDTTVAVDDFPMGIELQRGPKAQGLDPKGRILVTDPLKRRVLRFELPELVIVNATAANGIGSFDVVVPQQKAEDVVGVTVTVVPVESGVTVTAGSISPSAPVNIGPGEVVHYTFAYTLTGNATQATFTIKASGDGGLTQAPQASALTRLPCVNCDATHVVYNDPAPVSGSPVQAQLFPTPANGDWYGQELFVRMTPTGSEPVDRIGWYFSGTAGVFYGDDVHEDSVGDEGHVDALVRVAGPSTLTYWAIAEDGTAGPTHLVVLNVDLKEPHLHLFEWTAPTGVDPSTNRQWHNVPVTGQYVVTDDFAGTADNINPNPALPDGTVSFSAEGRDQSETVTVSDYAQHQGVYDSSSASGGRKINIDMSAPVFDSAPLVVTTVATGVDASGAYADLATGAFTTPATDPTLLNGDLGSRSDGPIAAASAAGRYRDGDVITFSATDYAGNTGTKDATIRVGKATPVVTVSGGPFTYNGTSQGATCTVTGVGGSVLTGGVISYPAGSAPVNVGTAAATCSFPGDDSYLPADGSGSIVINPRPVTVTAASFTKVVGQSDPALTYSITAGGPLVGTDAFSGAIVRAGGETVGTYVIGKGTLALSPNYVMTFINGTLTIIDNQPPVAVNDTASTVGAAPVTIAVLNNDSNPGGGTLTVSAFTQPATGGTVSASGNALVFTPTPGFTGTVTFTYTISDGQGGTATATVTVTITASACTNSGYLTYSQGGWGNSGAPGQFLAAKFAQVYPAGYVTIGGAKTLTFTSSNAINAFLPAGGTAAVLTVSAVNPTSSSAGNFAAQLLAMRLAVDFSAAGVTKTGMGSLVMLSGPFAGSTVDQIMAVANAVIGGQTSALPSGMSISTLSGILESLNMNFHEGTANNGLLGCPGQATTPTPTAANRAPDAVNDSASTKKDKAVTITVLANDTDADGDTLTMSSASSWCANGGTVVKNSNGTVTYTPKKGWKGTTTFTYTISDGKGGSDTATVTVKVS